MAEGAADLLQRLVLGNRGVAELTFDLERARFGKSARALKCEPPVFVTGLARAGTTALLRALAAQGRFATLTFRDMPFLLAPNSWARLSRGRNTALAERGQEDGILQDLDSPEALEEAFWRVFDGKRYIHADRLMAYQPPRETLEAYRTYVRLILLRHGGTRYLAKNNNNLLRLSGLVRAYPQALLVHPFREPVQHAASLRHHHLRAVEAQRAEPARLRYMDQLGHHEFGLGHRHFDFDGRMTSGDPSDSNHWLRQWVAAHRFLLDQPEAVRGRQMFVDVDAIARDRGAADAAIARIAGAAPLPYPPFRGAKDRALEGLDAGLLDQARGLHARLMAVSG